MPQGTVLTAIMEVESSETATRDEATINEAAEDGEESGQLVTKRNTSTPVWKHLGFEADKVEAAERLPPSVPCMSSRSRRERRQHQ